METPIPQKDTHRCRVDSQGFTFGCHAGLACFGRCCHKVELRLYPYDIIRLKNRLNLHSQSFLEEYTRLSEGDHPYFPAVMLNMADREGFPCPFLEDRGCSLYRDRPSACRTYPLERAVSHGSGSKAPREHYFLVHHPYCLGHAEDHHYSLLQWERQQQLHSFNQMNDRWAAVNAFFGTNPWQGEGKAGPRQQLAFMVCYNVDGFRAYMDSNRLLDRFRLERYRKKRIQRHDDDLLLFGFDWLLHVLGDRRTLIPR